MEQRILGLVVQRTRVYTEFGLLWTTSSRRLEREQNAGRGLIKPVQGQDLGTLAFTRKWRNASWCCGLGSKGSLQRECGATSAIGSYGWPGGNWEATLITSNTDPAGSLCAGSSTTLVDQCIRRRLIQDLPTIPTSLVSVKLVRWQKPSYLHHKRHCMQTPLLYFFH